MFVAWRDLRFARGRFTLIISVVILITLLVGLLSGLMTGLRGQNISAIAGIDADRVIFSSPSGDTPLSYSDSAIAEEQLAIWTDQSAEGSVQPVGIEMGRVSTDSTQLTASLFGVQPDFSHATGNVAPRQAGELVLSKPAAEKLHVSAGETVSIGGESFTVAAVTGDDWFSHTPVVWMNLADWQGYASRTGSAGTAATVLAVSGIPGDGIDSVNQTAGTVDTSLSGSFNAIGGFKSENSSLLAMLGMLLAISGLVIGAFFIVWTIQRTSDVAILKALGASTWSLVRDAMGQAVVVLGIGVGIGLALTVGLGALAKSIVPFVTNTSTTLLPGGLLILLGLLGAAFALRIITKSDPLTAIGNNR